MKRLILLIILMFVLSVTYAQDIEYADPVGQVIIEWDVVAPIEPTDIITYRAYTNSDMTGIVAVGDTALLQFAIIFALEGEYILGISTIREVIFPSFSEFKESDINWSDVNDPPGATPSPFVVRWVKDIQSPGNLRLQ